MATRVTLRAGSSPLARIAPQAGIGDRGRWKDLLTACCKTQHVFCIKTLLLAFTLLSTSFAFAESMYLPIEKITLETKLFGDNLRCQVTLSLNADLKYISEATLVIGEDKYIFPAQALSKIEYPDLASTRVETEKGMDGRLWYSIVVRPSRTTEYPTRFHITVIDGTFAQVSKSWDEPEGDSIRRHFEILHEQKK